MPTLNMVEWLLIAAAVVAVVLLLRWALGSRRHVEIAPPESTLSPTLSRVAQPAAPVLPVTDATSALIPIVPPAGEIPTLSIAPAVGESDDLLELKGVGPKLATLLNTLGVRRFDQIAAWSEEDIAEVDQHLGNFAGRIRRDRWVEQARLLATGEIAGFESQFGKLDNRPL